MNNFIPNAVIVVGLYGRVPALWMKTVALCDSCKIVRENTFAHDALFIRRDAFIIQKTRSLAIVEEPRD